jgi:hypothetical protein
LLLLRGKVIVTPRQGFNWTYSTAALRAMCATKEGFGWRFRAPRSSITAAAASAAASELRCNSAFDTHTLPTSMTKPHKSRADVRPSAAMMINAARRRQRRPDRKRFRFRRFMATPFVTHVASPSRWSNWYPEEPGRRHPRHITVLHADVNPHLRPRLRLVQIRRSDRDLDNLRIDAARGQIVSDY